MSFENKTVVITGGANGIGKAVSIAFAEQNANVIIIDKDKKEAEKTYDYISAKNLKCTAIVSNIDELHNIKNIIDTITSKYQNIDIFIGNAAILYNLSPINDYTTEQWHKTLNTNLTSNWFFLKLLDPIFKLQRHARVIFTTCNIKEKKAFWGPYSISKAALNQMVQIYAEEVKHLDIKVNLLDPGVVFTKIYQTAMPGIKEDSLIKQPKQVVKMFLKLASSTLQTSGNLYCIEE